MVAPPVFGALGNRIMRIIFKHAVGQVGRMRSTSSNHPGSAEVSVVWAVDEDNSLFDTAASTRWLSLPLSITTLCLVLPRLVCIPRTQHFQEQLPTESPASRLLYCLECPAWPRDCRTVFLALNFYRIQREGAAGNLAVRHGCTAKDSIFIDSGFVLPLANRGEGRPPEASLSLPWIEGSVELTNCATTCRVAVSTSWRSFGVSAKTWASTIRA
jgi:hypothetical protein